MILRDSIARLEALGPATPITRAQADAIRRLVAEQHDAEELLAAMGISALSPTTDPTREDA